MIAMVMVACGRVRFHSAIARGVLSYLTGESRLVPWPSTRNLGRLFQAMRVIEPHRS